MRSVKLTSADSRAWRANKAQWVSPRGFVLRAVTPEEEAALFPVVERAKRMDKHSDFPAVATYKIQDQQTGRVSEHQVQMMVQCRVHRTGRQQGDQLLDVYVNGNRYVKGREIIEKRLLQQHGECHLHGLNGKRLKTIRNPHTRRPTYAESQRTAPKPENCHCRAFRDHSTPGRHHVACEWNAKAPPHERALPVDFAQDERSLVDSPDPLISLFEGSRPSTALGLHLGIAAPQTPGRVSPLHAPSARVVPPPPPGGLSPSAVVAPGVVQDGQHGTQSIYAGQPVQAQPAYRPRYNPMEAPVFAPPVSAGEQAGLQATHTGAPNVEMPTAYGPDQCPDDCRGVVRGVPEWPWPPGKRSEKDQHHPLCVHEALWRRETTGSKQWMLLDVERNALVRDATVEEVAKAEVELHRSGTMSLTLNDVIYAVVPLERPQMIRRGRRALQPQHDHVPGLARAAAGPAVIRQHVAEETSRARTQALEVESARRAELEASGLPSFVPRAPAIEAPVEEPAYDARLAHAQSEQEAELIALRRRIRELEGGAANGSGRDETLQGLYPPYAQPSEQYAPRQYEPPQQQFQPGQLFPLPAPAPVRSAADHLRDGRGLIGYQQVTDDIAPGPVDLPEYEPFVDPLAPRPAQEDGPKERVTPLPIRQQVILPPPPTSEPAPEAFDKGNEGQNDSPLAAAV